MSAHGEEVEVREALFENAETQSAYFLVGTRWIRVVRAAGSPPIRGAASGEFPVLAAGRWGSAKREAR